MLLGKSTRGLCGVDIHNEQVDESRQNMAYNESWELCHTRNLYSPYNWYSTYMIEKAPKPSTHWPINWFWFRGILRYPLVLAMPVQLSRQWCFILKATTYLSDRADAEFYLNFSGSYKSRSQLWTSSKSKTSHHPQYNLRRTRIFLHL